MKKISRSKNIILITILTLSSTMILTGCSDNPDPDPIVKKKDNNASAGDDINISKYEDPGVDVPRSSLKPVSARTVLPAKVRIVFQAFDELGNPKKGLNKSDFAIEVDGRDISNDSESYADIVSVTGLGFSLPTIFVLDISSSISDADYLASIQGLRSLLLDENNNSKLIDGQSVAIVVFDGDVTPVLQLTKTATRIKASLDELQTLQRAGRRDNSSTNLYGAAEFGLGLWVNSFKRTNITEGYMVIIGDGADTANKVSKDVLLNTIATSGKKVFTIPTGGISAEGIADLNSLASSTKFAADKIDFSALETQLTNVGNDIIDIINAIYLMEFVTSSRSGDEDIAIKYMTGLGEPTITGTYATDGFSGVPRELWINNMPIVNHDLLNTDMNIPLGAQMTYRVKTKWSNTLPSYEWNTTAVSSYITFDMNSTASELNVTGTSVGSEDLVITDLNNIVGAGSVAQLSETLRVNVTQIDVSASSLSTNAGGTISLDAISSATNPPSFIWSNDNEGKCTLSSSSGPEVSVHTESYYDYYTCGIKVVDINNSNDTYYLRLTIGSEGTSFTAQGSTQAVDFDFESGEVEAGRFGDWEVVELSELPVTSTTNGNYLLKANSIGDNGITNFTITSALTTKISFDYYVSSEGYADYFTFFIDGIAVLMKSGTDDTAVSTFISDQLSDGNHTFTWEYTKDSYDDRGYDTVYLDNFIFE